MPSASATWQPMLLTDPAGFRRVMAQPSLTSRMRAWPGFGDMLVGEALRHGHRADPEAMDAVRELYAFGLSNGLRAVERLAAAEALRDHPARRDEESRCWEPFLLCDPSPEVAVVAAEALVAEGAAGAAALVAMIEARSCASRGGAFAALLRRGLPDTFALAGSLRHTLDLREVADALFCCGDGLSDAGRAFLVDWLDSLDSAEEPELADLLAQGVEREQQPAGDMRRVADHFLPREMAEQRILRPFATRASRRRERQGADLQA